MTMHRRRSADSTYAVRVPWSAAMLACALVAMNVVSAHAAASDEADAERAALHEALGVSEAEFATVMAILDEGRENNQVMAHLTYLCEEIGPRLTGSSRLEEANEWAAEQFESFGLENVQQDEWGTISVRFDRGPSTGRMIEPNERELEFTTRAWSAGTDGPVRGPLLREPVNEEEFEAVKDELEGAWILRPAVGGRRRGVVPGVEPPGEFLPQLREAGIAGLITASRDDRVRTGRVRGWRELEFDDLPDEVTVQVRRSDYDAMNSRLFDGHEVEVEFDLDHTFVDGPIPCYNTIAEIPGTEKPDEVVIISGHLDSWDGPGSQGTVDNGTGSSVTIEAARILSAVDARPKRTIRFILWTGEEQGLHGSRAYVDALSEEVREKISAVFVDDSGTNRQARLTCIEPMTDILERAIAPINYAFPDMQVSLRVRDEMPQRSMSDHAPFNHVGVPGFFWGKEGRANYRYAWHTQNDRLDQAIPEYLVQNSTASAMVAYMVANAETLLPRGGADEDEDEGDEQESETEAEQKEANAGSPTLSGTSP